MPIGCGFRTSAAADVLERAARLALSPVLLAQGAFVRARAVQLPEASGPRTGAIGSGPPLRLLIVGDSSAAGVGVARQSQALAGQLTARLGTKFTVDWRLIAQTGATTRSTLARLAHERATPYDVIVTALGVNDVTHAVPLAFWIHRQKKLLARLNTLYSARLVYMSGVPPVGGFPLLPQPLRWSLGRQAFLFDAALARILGPLPHAHHVPFNIPLNPAQMASDGFHPGPEIYEIWGHEMASRIFSDWPKVHITG